MEKAGTHGRAMPVGHPHEMLATEMAHGMDVSGAGRPGGEKGHGEMFVPGKNLLPHRVEKGDPLRFFAREGEDPLGGAFEGKIAVHPGMGGVPVLPEDKEARLERLVETPCQDRKLAYVHVPFCDTHCLYCSFFQNPYRREAGASYADALIRELGLWKGRPVQEREPVHAVYLGGGTPTALAPEDLGRILGAIQGALPLANDCEFTVEGRAANLTPELIEAALKNGVNRFSLGVQSFDTGIRRAMGRSLDQEELVRRIKLLQSYEQASIVVDLIYGLPGQSMEKWEEDLRIARSLGLDGLDCYQLGVHRGSPLAKAIEAGRVPPAADAPQMGEMFAASVRILETAFYRRLSVNHWGRTPRERNIYNLYTRAGVSCLGFGPGAGGSLHGDMTYNIRDFGRWKDMVEADRKPVGMLLAPVPLAELNKSITESLEQGRLDMPMLEGLCERQGYPGLSRAGELGALTAPLLEQWSRCGLLAPVDSSYLLTVAGQFWYVNLTQLLIEYIDEQREA
ncbi:heme anaerobic degradation radical SAM methyltransferase ChuW/HutW [Pseudodesulfovibrio alkaliphilus]|nr:heme anaerobic degradation radical SAM methyltransferase ChuW/HutW [Pseudodesulfovibrio alkaliphilus]